MINLRRKHRGAVTLIITTIILVALSLIVIFAAKYSIYQQSIAANANRNQQAYSAAEAGLEFGINYLKLNSGTIVSGPQNGLISYSDTQTTNIGLSNGSKFSVVYTNPVAFNYSLIAVNSTGVSDDGTGTRTMSQQMQFGTALMTAPTYSAIAKGNLTLGGTSSLYNVDTNLNIKTGGSATIQAIAHTTTSSGAVSTSSSLGADVQQNVTALSGLSSNDFFASFFAASMNSIKSRANFSYTNLGNYNSQLSNKTSSIIWIDDGNAVLTNTIIVGTPSNPVLLIVNGNLSITGSPFIFGVIYVSNNFTSSNGAAIYGAVISGGNITLTGSSAINYNTAIITNLRNSVGNYFAKVPGTWRDF